MHELLDVEVRACAMCFDIVTIGTENVVRRLCTCSTVKL